MPKATLTRAEMRSLREEGLSYKEIAARAGGIHPMYVGMKTRPGAAEKMRTYGRERYQQLGDTEQATYRQKVREHRQQAQEISLETAIKIGKPWTQEEISYLKKHGATKTILELAIDLGRTYNAVGHIAQARKISLRAE